MSTWKLHSRVEILHFHIDLLGHVGAVSARPLFGKVIGKGAIVETRNNCEQLRDVVLVALDQGFWSQDMVTYITVLVVADDESTLKYAE